MSMLPGAALRLSAIAAALLSASSALAATLTPIAPYADPAALGTSLFGINNAGWTTGVVSYADNVALGFLRSPTGEYTVFPNPAMPDAGTAGRGISNNNTIVGFSNPGGASTNWRSFQRTADGTVTNLTRPSDGLELAGIAQGINDAGAIAGNFRTRPGGPGTPLVNSGFILDGENFTELTIAGLQVNARGINNAGTVVGFTFNVVTGNTEALLYTGGSYEFFRHPLDANNEGYGSTIFTSINNVGQITGGYTFDDGTEFGQSRAFLFDPITDSFTDIVVPGAINTQTFGINDLGQYVISSDAGQFIYSPDGPVAPDGSAVFMPIAGGDLPPGQAQFAFAVAPGTTYYIDPPFAQGFEYLAGDGPLFASVIAPSGIFPSNIYELWLWNGSSYAFDQGITGGVEFTFGEAVDRFQLRGIPASAGIDPYNHEGFVTGLTFASAGQFNGFQNAIVGVPEPANWAMLIAGFGLVGAVQRRRRRQVVAA
jgi:hypothetical protein